MILEIFKSLQQHFTLPPVAIKDTIKCADWRYHDQIWFEFDLYLEGQDDEYWYSKQFYGAEFEEHCRFTNEIPVHGFYEWWEDLSWHNKLVEIETFVAKRDLVAEIKEDYKQWQKDNLK